jgi:hypothetical protein
MSQTQHIGLGIGIIILIAMMVICHYANKHFTVGVTDRFQNISANRINYYATSDCKNQTLACPGQHPMIPCGLIKKCPGTGGYDTLNEDDKKIVDMYVYLTSLLKSVDVFKGSNDDVWYR